MVVSPCTSTQSGLQLFEHRVEVGEDIGGQLGQALVGFHQVQVDCGVDVEQVQHLVQHLAVLGGDHHLRFDPRAYGPAAMTTGAILTASGRVPKIERTRVIDYSLPRR